LQPLGLPLHAIENASGLDENVGAFLVGIALTKEFLKDPSRIAFLRQGLRGCAPGNTSTVLCGGQFERRQTRVLTDMTDGDLVAADTGVRPSLAEIKRLHAGEPTLLDVRMRLVGFRGLVP
jgi:hypothetical protein